MYIQKQNMAKTNYICKHVELEHKKSNEDIQIQLTTCFASYYKFNDTL